jgi:hypothetical protein
MYPKRSAEDTPFRANALETPAAVRVMASREE